MASTTASASSSFPASARFDAKIAAFDASTATVLITGGSNGIGLSLAKRFLSQGATVIITGRREEELKKVQKENPAIRYYVSDAAKESDRIALAKQVTADYPKLNVFVNNAGALIRENIAGSKDQPWKDYQAEIDINFSAPIHYADLFIDHLNRQKEAALVLVTSGVAFVGGIYAPVYAASKSGLHYWILATRAALSKTNVRVVEIAPPIVKSGMSDDGITPEEFIDDVFPKFVGGELEIGQGIVEPLRFENRLESQESMFNLLKMMDPNGTKIKFLERAQ